MLKLLFNIFIVYAIWQLIRMFFTVKKVQSDFHKNMSDFTEKNNNTGHQGNPDNSTKTAESKEKKPLDTEGEYVDYEEIK